ncbi:MAG: type VI secretion system-associated protein TagF [Rhodothermia bacterium]|nr:type VI secretion system-associated protein TagF [Rhodothermia bacterium]
MTEVPNISFFGKTPSHADFVRYNTASDTHRSIDRWIQSGLIAAQQKNADTLIESYDAAGASNFVFWSDDHANVLVGALRPSRDSSGRRFPFFVATEWAQPNLRLSPIAQLPFSFKSFFDLTSTIVNDVVDGRLQIADLLQQLEDTTAPIYKGFEPSRAYGDVLQEIGFKEFCEQSWGSFEDVRKYALFKNLFDLLLPLRGKCPPPLGLGIVFPLCEDPRLVRAGVSFWLESCQRITGCPQTYPMLIWSRSGAPFGAAPSLYVNMAKAPASAFLQTLRVPTACDDVFLLEDLGGRSAAEVALSIPALYGSLIESEGLSLLDFVQRLG